MINSPAGLTVMQQATPHTPAQLPDITWILAKLSEMLANGLAQTAAQITNCNKMDLGTCIETIE